MPQLRKGDALPQLPRVSCIVETAPALAPATQRLAELATEVIRDL